MKLLEGTPATLGVTRVADLAIIRQHLSARSLNGLPCLLCGHPRDALITLAMVVCADIETAVRIALVPLN